MGGAGHRHAIANQTVPPNPSDATTPALLPSRNQPTRRLSSSCWQDVTRMKRWCRLSALQAKQALGHVRTWHRGTSAADSATAVPLPASLPKASSVCALGLTCAALEPRPTQHLLKSSSPSARSSARRHCASRIPPDPATFNLSRERFPFTCGRCEQDKLFDADRRAQALGDHHQRDHRPRHHCPSCPPTPPPESQPPLSPPATLAATALAAAAICASIHPVLRVCGFVWGVGGGNGT